MNKRKFEFALELDREMLEEPFSKISISQICDNLNCSRQSFYYYFKKIEDCLAYLVRETFKSKVREDYLISDIFAFFENNADFVARCNKDKEAKAIFWDSLYIYIKKMLDLIFSKNIVDYLSLYPEQKDAITSFYTSGILQQARLYLSKPNVTKEKCISHCKIIIGSREDTRDMIRRFNR